MLSTAVGSGLAGHAIGNDGGKDCDRNQKRKNAADSLSHGCDVVVIGWPDRSGCINSNGAASCCKGKNRLVVIVDLDAASSVSALRINTMDTDPWSWMQVNKEPACAFNIEKQARLLEQTPNAGPIAAQLFRAWSMQQTLLQQATYRIAALELQLMDLERQAGA